MAEGSKIRVLIADDSAFMRKVLLSILSADPQIDVVGEARDGVEAVSQSESLRPDVITMDINMPHMDGLRATEVIMSTKPRPVVVVSSESRDGAEVTLKALELGAIDFVTKPSSGIDLDMNTVREELVRKVKVASKVRVVRTAARIAMSAHRPAEPPMPFPAPQRDNGVSTSSGTDAQKPGGKFPIVVLVASTGGPATLMQLMPLFPKNFPGSVLIVQHMPGSYTSQFSEQLAGVSSIRISEATPGEIVQSGSAYVCPGSHHLRLSTTGRITLDDGPRINGYRPCADVTLEAVAAYAGPMAVSVVLTGMGNDGSRGVRAIKGANGHVIAQDEASCIIFGMPAEAIRTGSVDQVVSLDQVYPAIEKRVLYVLGAARVGAL